jgi:hypothetical protein
VQPRRLPDGFVEVQLAGQAKPDLYVLEIATNAVSRLPGKPSAKDKASDLRMSRISTARRLRDALFAAGLS